MGEVRVRDISRIETLAAWFYRAAGVGNSILKALFTPWANTRDSANFARTVGAEFGFGFDGRGAWPRLVIQVLVAGSPFFDGGYKDEKQHRTRTERQTAWNFCC
jgi:hypothetical protein